MAARAAPQRAPAAVVANAQSLDLADPKTRAQINAALAEFEFGETIEYYAANPDLARYTVDRSVSTGGAASQGAYIGHCAPIQVTASLHRSLRAYIGHCAPPVRGAAERAQTAARCLRCLTCAPAPSMVLPPSPPPCCDVLREAS